MSLRASDDTAISTPGSADSTGNRRKLHALNAMRFPAILLVFISHSIAATIGGSIEDSHGIQGLLYEAMGAVVFFLMLSGFIITFVYRDRIQTTSFRSAMLFTAARFVRFWPVHALLLALSALLVIGNTRSATGDWIGLFEQLTLVQAWDPYRALSFNSPAWTLSIELAAAPLLILIIGILRTSKTPPTNARIWLSILTLWMISTTSVMVMELMLQTKTAQLVAFTSPFNHLPVPLIGVLLAVLVFGSSGSTPRFHMENLRSWTILEISALMAIIGSALLRDVIPPDLTVLRYGPIHVPAAIYFIWVFAHDGGTISRWCRARWVQWLGGISFAFYLSHVLVLKILAAMGLANSLHPLLFSATALVISIVVAHIVHSEFELPLDKLLRARLRQRSSSRETIPTGEPSDIQVRPQTSDAA